MTARWCQEPGRKGDAAAAAKPHRRGDPVAIPSERSEVPEKLDDLRRARYRRQTFAWFGVRVVIVMITLPVVLSACGGDDPVSTSRAAGFPITVENCGRTVTFDKPAQRVLKDVPIIDSQEAALEPILESRVDLVIGYGLFETTAEDLASAGVESLVQSEYCGGHGGGGGDGDADFDDVYNDLESYGRIFSTEARAEEAIVDIREQVSAIASKREGKPRMTAANAYFVGDGLSVEGNQSMSQTLMDILGLTNVFADVDEQYIEGSLETLIKRNPDVLILTYGHVEAKRSQTPRSISSLYPARRR